MNINEAKQAANSAARNALTKCEEILKMPEPTIQDTLELVKLAAALETNARILNNHVADLLREKNRKAQSPVDLSGGGRFG